jgi:hypothetical protein
MKLIGSLLGIVMLVASGSSSYAADTPNWAMGVGSQSCAKFAQDYAKDVSAELFYFTWAQGFMTGLNMVAALDKKNIRNMGGEIIQLQQQRIREYCSEHPLDDYMQAVATMYGGLPSMGQPPLVP